jgi:hypothetical protein
MRHPRDRCRRRRLLPGALGAAALAAFLVARAGGAGAMVFTSSLEDRVLEARGEVVFGDAERFALAVRFLPPGRRPITLRVESRGGNLGEAAEMAAMVRRAGMTVVAVRECASACFLLLAAAPDRAAIRGARIGVHSARSYPGGAETINAMAATTHLARLAAGYGVPPAIIGRMVATGPAHMAWLDADDLRAMRVSILEPAPARPAPPPAAVRRAPPPPPAPPTPFALPAAPGTRRLPVFVEPPPGEAPPGAAAHARGVEDGAAWGCWLLRLSPVGPRGGPEFAAACAEARRLWPGFFDLEDPAYRRGWEAGAASVLHSRGGG